MAEQKYGASIRPRTRRDGSVAWDVRYRVEGKSRTTAFESQPAAEKWARVVRQLGPEEALRMLRLDVGATPTVDEYAERFIATKSGLEGLTTDHYRMFMRRSISPAMGSLPLDAVDEERIAAWVNAQVDDGLSAKTIANRHGFLSSMFQHALEVSGHVKRNPCARTNLPSSERREMVFLSADEFAELLSFIPPRWQPLVFLLASTGMRWGEVSALKPQDFDLTHGTVRISRAWHWSKKRGFYINAPKTKRSKRTISLPDDAIAVMRPIVESAGEWVFTNRDGGPVRQQKFHADVWTPARNLANGRPARPKTRGKGEAYAPRVGGVWDREPSKNPIRKEPRIHDLRHSHASWLINAGVPLTAIQIRLGHESIKTTSDTYGHLAPDMLRLPADVVGAALAGSMPEPLALAAGGRWDDESYDVDGEYDYAAEIVDESDDDAA